MVRKFLVFGAALAMFTGPALAADWYVIRQIDQPITVQDVSSCVVVDRPAAAGEESIAGPFPSQQEALTARHRYGACNLPTQN
jgi:hypothetical protein